MATEQTGNGWFWGRWSALGLGMAVVVVLVDQVHKWWMINVYEIAEKGRVSVTSFLDLVFVLNKGISYGLFTQDSQGGQLMLAGFALVVSIVMAVWLARAGSGWLMAVSVGLIIGGAIGNAIDRVHLGGVADFFSLHAFGVYWYVFNVADAAIVAGVVGLLYDGFIATGGAKRQIAE
ncbi:MAG: signal peptidase II [Pseudomonadota bacterium]